MTIKELRVWLSEEIEQAAENAARSARVALNSYGSGYDTGWRDALERVVLRIDDELDT